MTKAPHKVVLPGQAGEAVADALPLPAIVYETFSEQQIDAAADVLIASGIVSCSLVRWVAKGVAQDMLEAAADALLDDPDAHTSGEIEKEG